MIEDLHISGTPEQQERLQASIDRQFKQAHLIAVKEILTVFKLIRQASLDDKDLALDRAIDMYMKTQQDLYEGLN